MLRKPMRKRIYELNWVNFLEKESNPSQTWQRIRNQCITAINDLILLARKLPEDEQKEVFSPAIIEALVSQILDVGEDYPFPDGFNPRKAEIASRLVKRGIDLNSYQYRELNQETPSLIQPTINHIKQTVAICNDISYKVNLKNVQEEVEGSKEQYLFSWSNILGKEKNRLINFIISKTGYSYFEILDQQTKQSNKRLEINFGIDPGDPNNDGVFETLQITINDTNTLAKAFIFDSHHQVTWKGNLVVKEVIKDNNLTWRNNLNIFKPILDSTVDFNFYIKE